MAWRDVIRHKEKELVRASDTVKRIWLTLQDEYWQSTEKVIDGMKANKDNKLLFNIQNVQRAGRIAFVLGVVWRARRSKILRTIIGYFKNLVSWQSKAAKELGIPIQKSAEELILEQLLGYYGYKDNKVVEGSLFDALNPGTDLTADIARRIQNAMIMGVDKDTFRRQFRSEFNDPKSGFAIRYYDRWTKDLFFQFDRATGKALADKLKLEHAVYAGTLKDNTREFCEQRVNRVYTREEIAKWNELQWRGKNRTIPVELACGGYNCRHTFNYVTKELAEVLAKRQGGMNTYNQDIILDR